MKNLYEFTFIVVFFIVILAIIDNLENTTYGQNNKTVFTPADTPFNRTFADWAIDWSQWHISISNADGAHPRDNYSSEKCAWNQNSGPVWFLPDGFSSNNIRQAEVRECTIPANKAIMVMIVGSVCSTGEGIPPEELPSCAVWVLPKAYVSAKVDNKTVMNTKIDPNDRSKFYLEPTKTNLTYVDNSYYGYVKAGTYEGMIAGYFLFIPPLSPGKHTIQFEDIAIEIKQGQAISQRMTNVTYHITTTPSS